MEKLGFKPIPAAIALALALLIWFVIPVPEGVEPNAWHLLAMFVGVIAAIIGKAMPIGAISIVAIMLVALTGVTNDKPAGAMKDALSSFSNSLIWLIGVAVMISRGILKTGLGSRIGYLFIAVWGKKTLGIGYSLALSELLLAPVTPSNTARGGGIIHPVMKAIATSYDSDPEKGTQNRMGKYLSLVNYHSNPITSAMFITATAPNPLVVDLVAKATNSDIHLSWGTWALAMLVPGLVAMVLMPLILYFISPPEIKETPNAMQFAKDKLAEQGPMSRGEWIMLGIFGLLLFLWAGIPAMLFGKAYAVDPTTTAFIGLSLLLLSGVLTWDDILKEKSALLTHVSLQEIVQSSSSLQLKLHHNEENRSLSVETDKLILATGYCYRQPSCLKSLSEFIAYDAKGRFEISPSYAITKHNNLFVQNVGLYSHGLATPDLGMACYRNTVILREILGYTPYPLEESITFQDFS